MKRTYKSIPINFWKRLDALPPVAVRLLAKKPRHLPLREQAPTDEEIAEWSGLSVPYVIRISMRTDWHIPLPDARAFLQACGVDPADSTSMKHVSEYLSGEPRWRHLKHSPHFTTTFKPLWKIYASLAR